MSAKSVSQVFSGFIMICLLVLVLARHHLIRLKSVLTTFVLLGKVLLMVLYPPARCWMGINMMLHVVLLVVVWGMEVRMLRVIRVLHLRVMIVLTLVVLRHVVVCKVCLCD